ncbi:unnamed protein product [Polarella glacialis]|uniref:EF-hand domain-containing protein n=1 Tax=Polarella glacialis TaxID=89957 RepID=A0A813IY89_POLGL|nr:unnamed protein product [Polarella glacialis]
MATEVSFSQFFSTPADVISDGPALGQGSTDYTCAACAEAFANAAEQRMHCKSERHVYNTKRKLAGLKCISQEAWERKLRESRENAISSKGTAHLKAGKAERKGSEAGPYPQGPGNLDSEGPPLAPATIQEDEKIEFSPCNSLFDRRKFKTIEENLGYMWRTFNFFVPDREYCTDLEGLLAHVWRKCSEESTCLFCNHSFLDAASARRHMLDQRHCRIGTQARSRRGKPDELGSEYLQQEIEDYYDYTGSTREITERITDPEQKVASIFRFWDEDRDGFLSFKDLAGLWRATSEGAELSEALYFGACAKTGVNPKAGLDVQALGQLYAEGFSDLDQHFGALQDCLAKKMAKKSVTGIKRESRPTTKDPKSAGEGGTAEKESSDKKDDDEDEEDDSDSDGTEILECEDEEEFEEVMWVLGLQMASITENGDLRLPSGNTACARDVAYVWRQRGTRPTQLAVASGGRFGAGKNQRSQLMLSNAPSGCKIAVTKRERAREGKRIIAILKYQQNSEMRLGMKMNVIQKGKPQKFKTVVGDMSGGR